MNDDNKSEDGCELRPKPIGLNEGDFEAILLDGCLGFALSSGNAVLLLVVSMCSSSNALFGNLSAILMAMVIMILLRAGHLATDRLQTKAGTHFILYCQIVCNIAAIVFLGLGYHFGTTAFAGVGLVATVFLYGRFLGALAHRALALIIDIIFIYAALMFLLYSQLQYWYFYAIFILAIVLSVAISPLFTSKRYHYVDLVDLDESQHRSVKVKGNNHTLMLLGLMFSAILMAFNLGLPTSITMIALGSSIGLAGIVSVLMERVNEHLYKETLKKIMALTAALLLLPYPILPDFGRLICLSLFSFMVSLNVIILLNAIIETSRFNMVSLIWQFGKEGSVFFAGIFFGSILFSINSLFFESSFLSLYITCIAMVVISVWMQIRVNYQVYPFEPIIEAPFCEETQKDIDEGNSRKALWQQKRQIACDRYKLSPREREILQILLKGRDARYIMEKFYISQSTAKTHIYNIYRKFGIHSRQELLDFIEDIDVVTNDTSEV